MENTTKSIEDYLKTIYILVKEKGVAKTLEISSMLNVRPPSVSEMIQKMSEQGLVSHKKYRGITLTKKGERLAKEMYTRNETLVDFLKIIGVDEEIAKEDACRMEHDLDPMTMEYLTQFVEFVQTSPRNPRWLEHFRYYIKTGTHKKCRRL